MTIWTMPDGSRWDIPDAEPPPETRTPMVVREFLRRIGKRGGQMRAQRQPCRTAYLGKSAEKSR